MRNYDRFIPGEEVGAVEQWSFEPVDTAAVLLAAQEKVREEVVDQAKEEALKQAAHAAGFAAGFIQGQAQAALEAQRQITDYIATEGQKAAQDFAALFVTAQAQMADAEQVLARGVLDLACELARQVVRRELLVNTDAARPVVREALGLLAADTKSAVIRLNPLDLVVLEPVIRVEFASLALTLLPDEALSRGGCLVESAGTVVDGTLEKRWARAVATLGLESVWEVPADEH
jgi:flagellar assembly protein FliH